MADSGEGRVGTFHSKCSQSVVLSKGRRVASGLGDIGNKYAFSNQPIPIGLQFSVKILQESSLFVFFIGVTTTDPDTGPVPQQWSDIDSSDKYWRVLISSGDCAAKHKGQERELQWVLDRSAGNTIGLCVLGTGELHLYHNGKDMGVVWERLPTDQPLWGFVDLDDWKVEANYIIPNVSETPRNSFPPEPKEVGASSNGHPQDYASKTFHFVERPPEGLICAVCQALAYDPVQANCCGNIYCTRCIEKWKNRSNSCPTCRSTEQSDPTFNVFPDRRAYRDVRNLLVHCPNSCGKRMELSAVENHLMSDNGCLDQVVECGNTCGHKERRATVKKHMTNECRLRCEKCKYCPLVSTHEEVTGAHLEVCPSYPLDCPNRCGAGGVTRSTVPAHQKVCPLQRVECEYKRFGCTVVLPRKNIAEHLKSSVETHLQLTKRRVEEQEVCLQEQEVRLKDVEKRSERERQKLNEVIACLVDRVEQLERRK